MKALTRVDNSLTVAWQTEPLSRGERVDAETDSSRVSRYCKESIPCKYRKPEKGNILMPVSPSALGVYRVKLENPIPAEWDAFPPSVAEQVTDVNGIIIIR